MEELGFFDQYPVLQFISYIITVIIGGVGYKFYKLYIDDNTQKRRDSNEHNQSLIDNLKSRVDTLTTAVERFDKERKEMHERELKRVQELSETRAQVKILTHKVKYLETALDRERLIRKKYEKEFGKLDSIEDV